MHRFLLILLIPFAVFSVRAADDWKLVWSDEFDGPSLDLNKWEFEIGGKGNGNHELFGLTQTNWTSKSAAYPAPFNQRFYSTAC